jgi:hypothetical protein
MSDSQSDITITGETYIDGMSKFLEQLRNNNGWERVDVIADGNCMLYSVIGASYYNNILKDGLNQLVGKCNDDTEMANKLRTLLGKFYIELSQLPESSRPESSLVKIRKTLTDLPTDWVKEIPKKKMRT